MAREERTRGDRAGLRAKRDLGERVFRALTAIYPPAFRRAYLEEMVAFFAAERRAFRTAAGGGGGWRRSVFWLRTVGDVALVGLRMRWARRTRGRWWMTGWVADLRQSLRSLKREPAFTMVALGTVVLGVGATTAIFTVVDGVVLRPLPYEGAERLVVVGSFFEDRPAAPSATSVGDYRALRDRSRSLSDVVLVRQFGDVLLGEADPRAVDVGVASRGYFEMFEGRVAVGRLPGSADHAAGAPPVAVLDHRFWLRRFGGDPEVVGRTLALEGNPVTIVGVLDPAFLPPESLRGRDAVAWTPLADDEEDGWYGLSATLVARLRPETSVSSATEELERLGQEISETQRPDFPYTYRFEDLQERTVGSFRETGATLLAGALLLLLIATANLANLSLTRRVDREREISVRVALGAGRARVLRLVAVENALVALGGTVGGLAMAALGIELLQRFSPGGIPRLAELVVDGRVALFAGVASLTVATLAGIVPGLRRTDPAAGPSGGSGRGGEGREVVRFRRAMVVAETGLALVLLTAAGLLGRSLYALANQDTGLPLAELASLRVDVRRTMDAAEQVAAFRALEESVRALPAVRGAGWISVLPFTADGVLNRVTLERTTAENGAGEFLPVTSVSPALFDVVGLRVGRGRGFSDADAEGSAPVAVANAAFVRLHWPNEPEAVGLRFWYGDESEGESVEVVGVVSDMAYRIGDEPLPQLFVPLAQSPWGRSSLVVRTAADPDDLLAPLAAVAREAHPTLPVDVAALETLYEAQLVRPRFYALLIGAFATLAVALALVGLYGTVGYAVRRRTRELGIRLALGASAPELARGVVRRGLLDAAVGVGLGVVGSVLLGGALAQYLYRIEPTDPPTLASTALLLLAASVFAAWIPARRIMRVDPKTSFSTHG